MTDPNGRSVDLDALADKVAARLSTASSVEEPDIYQPLTARAMMPRRAHVEDSIDEQGLCFVEGQRQAWEDWMSLPDEQQTDQALADMSAQARSRWADWHGVDPGTPRPGPQTLESRDIYAIPEYETAWTRFWGNGERLVPRDAGVDGITGPLKTKAARAWEQDGDLFDRVQDDRNAEVCVRCRHETESEDPADHPFQLPAPPAARGRPGAGQSRRPVGRSSGDDGGTGRTAVVPAGRGPTARS